MSQALENCSWLRTVVIVCVVFASIRTGLTQQIDGVGASATIEPAKFPANGSVVLRVHIHPAKPLATGAIITTQLPNAMLAEELSYSLTKKIALAKGGFDWDNVMVQATGNPDAKFDVKIETHEPEDQNLPSRHGQRVSATLTSSSLPAASRLGQYNRRLVRYRSCSCRLLIRWGRGSLKACRARVATLRDSPSSNTA